MKWISPSTITGDAATDKRYLRRPYINELFWREVEKGNHILFVAPRRVGKTSIMMDLAANPLEGYACIYQNIEGVKTRNEFYHRLFCLILQCLDRSPIQSAKAFLQDCLKKYKIKEMSKSGVKFESQELDYEVELRKLIPDLKNAKIHTVIFLDEFAELISKLKKNDAVDDAIDILHTLREMRSDKDFAHFTLVFAGSIGLHFVIKSIDRPKLINDLHSIEASALTSNEAMQLINQLTSEATIKLSTRVVTYMLGKLGHLLPYYVQLMLEEIDLLAREKADPIITEIMIDESFNRVLSKNKNFDDWLERLKEYHHANFSFINHILKHAAHHKRITIQDIYNLALDEDYQREHDYMDFVEQLLNEGYLVKVKGTSYSFISPFLQQFWLKKYPVYHGRRTIY